MKIVPFSELLSADLIVDAVYEGGHSGNTSDDPISKLLPGCGNMSGFRHSGRGSGKKYVVLYTSGEDKDWPDSIDLNMGKFTYYGDNKTPGHELHDTPRKGNLILRNVFNHLHANPPKRNKIPPFFIFCKYATKNSSRSVQFKGLAVPGHPGIPATEDLIAVWKTTGFQRFQNYRSVFTILDVAQIERKWIADIANGKTETVNTPGAWKKWVNDGIYAPLISKSTTMIRSVEDQMPQNKKQEKILETVFGYFEKSPITFESFAARIFQLYDSRAIIDEITRGVIDGGRDAIGRYLLGLKDDPVYAEFALEAKCYRPPIGDTKANTVGVKEVARLISRLRHRQFGVLVTTSVVAKQAYEEVRNDKHPVVFICGKDIVEILVGKGFNTPELVINFLQKEFPVR